MKASVAGPVLAPRPAGLAVTAAAFSPSSPFSPVASPADCLTHSDAEWTAAYPEIERLYVRERRKLRHVMQYMESRHRFKATVQMYKKRFAKWGFQKNARRRPTGISSQTMGAGPVVTAMPPPAIPLPAALPSFGPQDALALLLFTSVRSWTGAFFELPFSAQHKVTTLGTPALPAPTPAKAKEISFAFKLAMDLLERGHGDLAGRTARKAFLLVEDLIATLAAPALVWNLLEIMHHMLAQKQTQLFQMLLAHISALVARDAAAAEAAGKDGGCRMFAAGHPLPALLHGLRGIAASNTDALKGQLEQAWTLNAELVFAHFHPRLLNLYCLVLWESCSIGPPAAIVGSVVQWFRALDGVEVAQEHTELREEQMHEYSRLLRRRQPQQPQQPQQQQAVTPRSSTDLSESDSDWPSPPPQPHLSHPPHPHPFLPPPSSDDDTAYTPYARLHASSLAALRAHSDTILCDGEVVYRGDPAVLLRILAGLTTAKILQGMPDTMSVVVQPGSDGSDESWDLVGMPRLHLSNVACVIRTLTEIEIENAKQAPPLAKPSKTSTPLTPLPSVVDHLRAVVDLRSQADGRTDPQVMLEMWLLQDALEAAGERDEARLVEREAYARIDTYVQEIPVDAA
ncbi:hypothetical protein SCUCBS95973_001523 [Sporothrix curviconia]|uniref:Clr5 domain-containing protein n=1 Tax=Sporothrix curviconia TaxID=1260050 RepID=A0ABP0AZ97_9PEZI